MVIKGDLSRRKQDISKCHNDNKTFDLLIPAVYLVPWRTISRIWGRLNKITLPELIRPPLFKLYAHIFDCNLDEMENGDLYQYMNLSEFFRRSLKFGVRPINFENGIVSPADGQIVQQGEVPINGGYIGNVKGIHYSVKNFLGINDLYSSFNRDWSLNLKQIQPGHRLYSTVIYLAPGDYHRFHSPVDWTVFHRRHFSGKLFSVKPSLVAKFPDLFSINERVVYFGRWKYGFFSMAAVGAVNVGTINVFFDQELKTNQFWMEKNYRTDRTFKNGRYFSKGELFGEFNLGSTMVMIYEAPEQNRSNFEFEISDRVKYGELVLRIEN